MPTKYWLGTADAVAQVDTVQVTADDAATTYMITIGGVDVSVSGTGTGVNDTASALSAALNASSHPYFAAVTWSAATDTVTGTADTAGVPFVASSSVSGGTGTIGAVTNSTPNAGPNVWGTATNWSDGSAPGDGDTVIIADSSVNICWGLAQDDVELGKLDIRKTYTGKIGLDYTRFATSANGATYSSTPKREYREDYLTIDSALVEIGEHVGPGTPAGSGRIKLDLGSYAAAVTVHGTASISSETGRYAVRLLCDNAATTLDVRYAPAGVAVANEIPGETSTIGSVRVTDTSATSRVVLGDGVTITTWEQWGGTNVLAAAATVTTVSVYGGDLVVEGDDYTITTLNVYAGTVRDNHDAAGTAITTANIYGGTLDGAQSTTARTWATVNHYAGALLRRNSGITITTWSPTSAVVSIACS